MPLELHQHHLLIIQDDKGRREFILENSLYSIGRDPDCDIRLNSQFVSRHHAILVQLHNENDSFSYRIVDGDTKGKASSNGLLINGKKLKSYDLQHEDKVVFGPNVSATYLVLRRDSVLTIQPDEFDITLTRDDDLTEELPLFLAPGNPLHLL